MSRVEDGDDARTAARLAEAKRNEEAGKAKKKTEGNAFSKLVGQQKQHAQKGTEHAQTQSAMAQLLGDTEALAKHGASQTEHHGQAQQAESGFKSKLGQQALGEKGVVHSKSDGDYAQGQKLKESQGDASTGQARQSDQTSTTQGNESRRAEGKSSNARNSEKSDSNESSAQAGAAGGAKGEKGDIKTDADKGGGGQQQSGGQKDSPALQPGFRFNPALMAPVSVAKPREASGSDRLRKVANEIAQKIVERVRVGTNSMGAMEFQVDLRGDVLSGLSMKVSAKNGKITAVFSGSNRDVLKMLEEQEESLKGALAARGLSLENFKVETRT
jgi:hypothetical protein